MRQADDTKRTRKSALGAGFSSGFGGAGGLSFVYSRRRPSLFEKNRRRPAVVGDLVAVWSDFSAAIESEAGKYFRGNYKVYARLNREGNVRLEYERIPQNKKMEEAGGWGK